MPPYIKEENCKKCNLCAEACQSDVFYGSVAGQIPVIAYPDECWHCYACVIECKNGAIEMRIPINLEPMIQIR